MKFQSRLKISWQNITVSQFLVCLSGAFFMSLLFFNRVVEKPPPRPLYFAPSHLIRHFSFGFSDLYADILWVRLVHDIDFCNSKQGIPIYDGREIRQCEKGWSFKMTSAITELAPRFVRPYEISGSILSVIMKDKQGAKQIYDKAVKNFPQHWRLHFSAGYHYLLELKREEEAARLLTKAADLGGPPWLYVLAAKTYSQMGKLLLAQAVLADAIKKDITGQYKKGLIKRLKKVEREIRRQNISFQPALY